MDAAVGAFSNLIDSSDSSTMCVSLVIRLALILSIIIVIKKSNNNPFGTDAYNLSITQLVFLFLAIINLIRYRPKRIDIFKSLVILLFLALPLTQIVLIITEGSDSKVSDNDFAIAIASICMSIIYIIF